MLHSGYGVVFIAEMSLDPGQRFFAFRASICPGRRSKTLFASGRKKRTTPRT